MSAAKRVTDLSIPSMRTLSRRSAVGDHIDYASAVQFCPLGIVLTDPSKAGNPIVFVNPAFTELTGYSPAEAIGRNCRFLQGPDTDRKVVSDIRDAIAQGQPIRRGILNYRKNGTQFWTDLAISPTHDELGDVVGFVGVLTDVTDRRLEEAMRGEAEARVSSIVENMPGYVFRRIRKHDGRIEFPNFSPSFSRIICQAAGSVATATDLWKHMNVDDIAIARRGIERSAADLSPLVLEFRLMAGTDERWIRTNSTPKRQSNGDVVWDGVGIDVTAEKATEIRLAYLVHHDPLTGLANRELLAERLASAIEAARKQYFPIALSYLLFVDFSEVNETLGTNDSDAALRGVAARISELAITDRYSVPARLGGAEFAILRSGETAKGNADEFAGIMMQSVAQPVLVGTEALTIESCVGTALFDPDDLRSLLPPAAAAELMKRAAIALSAAHKAGPGTHRLYDEELDHRTRHRMVLRHSMRHAIDEDQFELHYQPLVDLQSGRIVSAEALVRWQHPEFGLLRPDLFISLAEESGLIGLLGEWVMRTAMRQMKLWEAKGLKPPKIAVNISGVQLKMADFVETAKKVLTQTGADARRYELELTEGVLLENSPDTLSALAELKLLGFALVIDDFGAGHASFQYLRNFPIDKIKIDQIFVRQLVVDSSDAVIIRAIAALAQNLKIGLVAEGIETVEQRDFLRDQGCTTGQGYFFSLPLTAEDFAWMIEQEVVLPIIPGKKHDARRARRAS
jgi:PAS domain S-box-containing protein/diguanylate cyclase (GGDEF)-like protein